MQRCLLIYIAMIRKRVLSHTHRIFRPSVIHIGEGVVADGECNECEEFYDFNMDGGE